MQSSVATISGSSFLADRFGQDSTALPGNALLTLNLLLLLLLILILVGIISGLILG